jgi:multicomponent Na+:H+ antiporter subunit G
MNVLEAVSGLALLGGVFFMVVGGIGTLRLPDFYTRLHAAGMTDTLGAGLILVGLMFQGGMSQVTIKLILILLLLWCTSPVSTHALVRAALADPDNPRPLLHQDPAAKETSPSNS